MNIFSRKKFDIKSYDKSCHIPQIKESICNGEQVAGFKNLTTGKFEKVMLIRNAYVISYSYDELIDLAENMGRDIIFDPKYESNRGYYVYGVENHKLKVVILTGAY